MKTSLYSLPAASLLALYAFTCAAADWPQWRGPNRDDHSPDKGLLKQWPEGGPKRVWCNGARRMVEVESLRFRFGPWS